MDTISIVTFAQEATTSENAISLNVVQIILSKKCCTLHIGDEMSKVSHSDVEKLIAVSGKIVEPGNLVHSVFRKLGKESFPSHSN